MTDAPQETSTSGRVQDSKGERGALSRRKLLAASVSAVLAGCINAPQSEPSVPETEAGEVATGVSGDVDLPVEEGELVRGVGRDVIPAITDPTFDEDWAEITLEIPEEFSPAPERTRTIEPRLRENDTVIGVARAGEARAYPLRILNWHEVVNDTFGEPIIVTYCPLCRSAIVAERTIDGELAQFGVSGLLFKNDLVMYDSVTDSLWSQILATAINGPMTGERLEFLPFTLTTLEEWRDTHPETSVLRPPPESTTITDRETVRDYTTNPYVGYQDGDAIGLDETVEDFDDGRLHPKTQVLGIEFEGVARAYSVDDIQQTGLLEDEVNGLPVVVTTAGDEEAIAWVRCVDDTVLEFDVLNDDLLSGGGSRWDRTTGVAVDGPHEGTQLDQANAVSGLFWFAWLDFHPETELYER